MRPLIFCMNTFIAYKNEGEKLFFGGDEAWHCAKVLRMKPGETIRVIDGAGNAWEAKLLQVHEKECTAQAEKTFPVQQRKAPLHIAIAPTKNMDRVEWFTEKATELGIARITFILSKNSERKMIRTDRIRKIAESAVKQSMQSFIPDVTGPLEVSKFIEEMKHSPAKRFIAHCDEGIKNELKSVLAQGEDCIFLVGPEGDFTKEEIALALQSGFVPVSLGESRLRTETAGVYVAGVVRFL